MFNSDSKQEKNKDINNQKIGSIAVIVFLILAFIVLSFIFFRNSNETNNTSNTSNETQDINSLASDSSVKKEIPIFEMGQRIVFPDGFEFVVNSAWSTSVNYTVVNNTKYAFTFFATRTYLEMEGTGMIYQEEGHDYWNIYPLQQCDCYSSFYSLVKKIGEVNYYF
ncbi:MAG: hypothetical protein IJU84_05990, partial [Clostridia bacterium]|nr:hypothetical protein [Clostridia bacterium]